MPFDIHKVRADFPILQKQVYGKPLIYLDNAATTQKPRAVIERISKYYSEENCNIHRGVHYLSQEATAAFEETRSYVASLLNAARKEEIVFTKGATESINLVASAFGRKVVGQGDEVIISAMEHHSNLVPWQRLCKEKGAILKVLPFNEAGELNIEEFESLISSRTRMVALAHVSNALGTINPVKEMTDIAHRHNIPVILDGAQALAHLKVDLAELDCDFYCFSGHKAYAPMGVGVLYGKMEHLEFMDPYQTGGEMVDRVRFEDTTFNEIPFKFEAGTPNVESVLGLGAALRYIEDTGFEEIIRYEESLLSYASGELKKVDGLRIIGNAKHKTAVISFLIGDIHPYDAGTILDKLGIAIRTGHHCAQPVMDRYGITGTIRASLAMYNTKEEIDYLVGAIQKVKDMFS